MADTVSDLRERLERWARFARAMGYEKDFVATLDDAAVALSEPAPIAGEARRGRVWDAAHRFATALGAYHRSEGGTREAEEAEAAERALSLLDAEMETLRMQGDAGLREALEEILDSYRGDGDGCRCKDCANSTIQQIRRALAVFLLVLISSCTSPTALAVDAQEQCMLQPDNTVLCGVAP